MENYSFEYLPWRGVTKETFEFFGVKTKIDQTGKPVSVGFPYKDGSWKERSLHEKDFWIKGSGTINKAGTWASDRFNSGQHKHITITEGELDACSIWQVLRGPVVSVQSSSTAVRDCTIDRDYINSFERIILAFDGDSQGRKAAEQVAKLFDPDRLYQIKFDKRKDANAYLEAGEAEDLRHIWWNASRYLPETVVSGLPAFREILLGKPKWGTPYPFPGLTAATYGLRTGETVLITAPTGVGKTEVMHAIEHRLLTEGHHVGAIFLEENKKRHLQAMAGYEIKKPVHLPDCDVEDVEIISALSRLTKEGSSLFLYSHFGSDDPSVILDTIRFLVSGCGCSFVMLDPVGLVVSGLGEKDERRALDFFTTRLEMMVQELGFGLIIVSHVNDEGQPRGSRWIGNIAHIRLDLSRDHLHPDPNVRAILSIRIIKNRFHGVSTGTIIRVKFDTYTQTWTEVGDETSSAKETSPEYPDVITPTQRQTPWQAYPLGTQTQAMNDNGYPIRGAA